MSENPADKQRLLIVDDSRVIRVTARKILQNHFAIVEAVDGEDAWEKLTTEPSISLVVSDLTMPKLDGFDLLDRIRNSHDPLLNKLPVIIITGANDSETTMQRARTAGATDFIGKPFDAVHLLARTQAHANAHATSQALGVQAMSLESQSTVDALTGLANESAFLERGLQMLSYAIRHNGSLAVAQIEIDHFGELFRSHGKAAADQVLEHIARLLESGIRSEDMVARIGAARFALLLPAMDASGVRRLADRISGEIRKRTVMTAGQQLRYTVSIGIAAPEIRQNARLENLLNAAANSLREAITAGGDHIASHVSGVALPDGGQPVRDPQIPAASVNAATAGEPEPPVMADPSSWTLAGTDGDSGAEGLPEITVEPAMLIEETVEIRADKDFYPATAAETEAQPEYVLEEEIEITSPYAIFDKMETADAEMTQSVNESAQAKVQEPEPQTATVATAASGVEDKPASGTRFPKVEDTAEQAADLQDNDSEQPPAGLFRRMLRWLFRTGH